jgi:hypothetical protein
MAMGGIFKKAFKSIKLTKRDYDPEIISINDIEIPIIYKDMDMDRILRDIKSELLTYKSLGYRFKESKELDIQEYHTFQIGLLLNALKNDVDLNVRKPKEYIPKNVLTSTKENLIYQISEIIKKFDKEVPKGISEVIARDDFIWTPLDAGYLLYYLSIYKEL